MSFAESLTNIVIDKRFEQRERVAVATKWKDHESSLLDQAVKLFKQRCTREAQQQRCHLSVSFEVLSREIDGFPTHVQRDGGYFVNSWGPAAASAESWHFATKGASIPFVLGKGVLFAEMLESMMPKFVDRVGRLGFRRAGREPGTWKVTVAWMDPDELPDDYDERRHSLFAYSMTKLVQRCKQETVERQRTAAKWLAYEAKLLDKATEMYKDRCMQEAAALRCSASVSFEVLSREVPGFPTRVIKGSNHVVDSWGDGSAESWWYATRGASASWSPGAPIPFAEVLEAMMPKFIEKLQPLGFHSCKREQGTWKVVANWSNPQEEEEDSSSKRRRTHGSAGE